MELVAVSALDGLVELRVVVRGLSTFIDLARDLTSNQFHLGVRCRLLGPEGIMVLRTSSA